MTTVTCKPLFYYTNQILHDSHYRTHCRTVSVGPPTLHPDPESLLQAQLDYSHDRREFPCPSCTSSLGSVRQETRRIRSAEAVPLPLGCVLTAPGVPRPAPSAVSVRDGAPPKAGRPALLGEGGRGTRAEVRVLRLDERGRLGEDGRPPGRRPLLGRVHTVGDWRTRTRGRKGTRTSDVTWGERAGGIWSSLTPSPVATPSIRRTGRRTLFLESSSVPTGTL